MKKTILGFLVCVLLAPAAAFAQASITGTVRDASGAVLPGVTVEAASPALIEKVRSVVTDGTGQYRVVDLRPGPYTVTFSLTGFSTVRREGIELTGNFTATVNADMRVGALEETITVTGESPIVDVQSARQQRTMDADLISEIPTARRVFDVAVLVPGVTSSAQDVGGIVVATNFTLSVHGSRPQEQRVQIGGVSVANVDGQGGFAQIFPNMSSIQEVVIDTGGGGAEAGVAGVGINVVQKEGGNTFSGTLFSTYTTGALQGSNYTSDLKARGLLTPGDLVKLYDVNPAFGGRVIRDRLWFYSAARWQASTLNVPGMFYNANFGKTTIPEKWLYAPDASRPASNRQFTKSYNTRLTLQASPRNKLSFFMDNQAQCRGCFPFGATNATPETNPTGSQWPFNSFATAAWQSPLTSRVLLEATFLNHGEKWRSRDPRRVDRSLIPVTEQSTGVSYISSTGNFGANYPSWRSQNQIVKASVSYVTGAHNFKVGVSDMWGWLNWYTDDNDPHLSYRFNNGVPNQITQRTMPFTVNSNIDADLGVFAQDQWTIERLTLSLGLQYDHFKITFPEQVLGPTRFAPNRNVTLPREEFLSWHDVTPRMAVAYDLFGDGRTAVKVSANKYVAGNGLSSSGIFGALANPTIRVSSTATRTWNDANRNFEPDCDLLNFAANGECAQLSDLNLGNPRAPSIVYDPETLSGWGKRGYNWEFSTSVQHQVLTGMSVNVGYFRRIYGNFTVSDNRAVTADDFGTFSVTAPSDSRLPDGGGFAISGLQNVSAAKFGLVDNYLTFSKNFGKEIEHWNGVDVSVTARLPIGVQLQGGSSTGRTSTNNCEIVAKLPEINPLGAPYCRQDIGYITQFKGFATYTIPRIDVLTSATLQSIPGPVVAGNYVATPAEVALTLGRTPTGGSQTVNLLTPGAIYGDRLTQLDLRVGKVIRFGGRRANLNLDIYNALNSSAVLTENANFASFRRPTNIVQARFAKINVQFDF